MTPEFKAKWLEALRSGKYQQAHGVMRDENGCMCCLGVAAELIDPTKWNPHSASTDEAGRGFGWSGDKPDRTLEIANALDLDIMDVKACAARNDGNSQHRQHSFLQMADYIEKEIEANDRS